MVNKIDKQMGRKLRSLRNSAGITQEELAVMLGFKTRVSIVNLERGIQSFTTRTIYLVCCIFNVTPTDLFPEIKPVTIRKIGEIKQTVIVKKGKHKISKLPKI